MQPRTRPAQNVQVNQRHVTHSFKNGSAQPQYAKCSVRQQSYSDGGNLQAAALPEPLSIEDLHLRSKGAGRIGSPWHVRWLGEPARQLTAAHPDIALLS